MVARATKKVNFRKIFRNLLRNRNGDEAETCINAQDISLFIVYVFCSGRIRTLVAMVTYFFPYIDIMGKVKID